MNQNTNSQDDNYQDEINIKEIISALHAKKSFIGFIVCFFTFSAIIYSLWVPKIWDSSALLTLSGKNDSSSSSSSVSGIASLAGLRVPGGSSQVDQNQLIISSIHSRDFFKHLLSFDDVLPNIMATKTFNEDTKRSVFDSRIYDVARSEWVLGKPTFFEAFDEYKNAVSTHYDPMGTGLITISVQHRSPIFAHQFLTLIIAEINNTYREKDLIEARSSLTYLKEQLNNDLMQAEVQLSIAQLIESQLRKQMFANIRQHYILDPLDTPYIPELRSSPQRAKMVIVGTLLGLLSSIIYVLGQYYLRKSLK